MYAVNHILIFHFPLNALFYTFSPSQKLPSNAVLLAADRLFFSRIMQSDICRLGRDPVHATKTNRRRSSALKTALVPLYAKRHRTALFKQRVPPIFFLKTLIFSF